MIKPFIKESTATTGTGALTLSSVSGFARFLDGFAANASVVYAIENGANRETGIGTIRAGNILERTTPLVTLVGGVYDASTPAAIILAGTSSVYCDLNASASATIDGYLSKADHAAFSAKVGRTGDTMTGELVIAPASGDMLTLRSGASDVFVARYAFDAGLSVNIMDFDFSGSAESWQVVDFHVSGVGSQFRFAESGSGNNIYLDPQGGIYGSTNTSITFMTQNYNYVVLDETANSFYGTSGSYHDLGNPTAGAEWGNCYLKGDLSLGAAGNGIKIKEGSNATMGVSAAMVAGVITVNTTKVTANSRIFLTPQTLGTVALPKAVGVTARVAGTSFTIKSEDNTDTSTVAWMIVEPA